MSLHATETGISSSTDGPLGSYADFTYLSPKACQPVCQLFLCHSRTHQLEFNSCQHEFANILSLEGRSIEWHFLFLLLAFFYTNIEILGTLLHKLIMLMYDNYYFQSVSATHITVTENQIKCDLLRTLPNNERFRTADCDGVRFYFAL